MRAATLALIILSVTLGGCGGSDVVDTQVTETRIDDLDSLEGTISDEMINTNEVNEQAMMDNASEDDTKPGAKKASSKPEPKAESAPAAGE